MHYVVSKYSIWNIARCCFPSMPVPDTKQTHVIMPIGILTHSFSHLGTDTNAAQSVPSPCDRRRGSAITARAAQRLHSASDTLTSLSRSDSVSQLFPQTFLRRSQQWFQNAKSHLNRMQEITCIINNPPQNNILGHLQLNVYGQHLWYIFMYNNYII